MDYKKRTHKMEAAIAFVLMHKDSLPKTQIINVLEQIIDDARLVYEDGEEYMIYSDGTRD